MGLKSKVGSKLSGAAKRADMLGAIVGYIGTIATAADAAAMPVVPALVNVHVNAVSRHNIGAVAGGADQPGSIAAKLGDAVFNPLLMTGIGIGVAGVIVSNIPSVVPWQGSAASIAKKAGFGMAIGSLLAMAVYSLGEGSSPLTLGGSSSTGSKAVTTAGRFTKPTGQFSPPSPSVGSWSRPSQ